MATLTLACIGDVHGRIDRLEQLVTWLSERDVAGVLLAGDFAPGRKPMGPQAGVAEARRAVACIAELGVPVVYVPGNHDDPNLDAPGNIDWTGETIAGVRIAGIGGSGPAHFGFPYEWEESDVRTRTVPERHMLLCHAPPARTFLDGLANGGPHVGSEAVRALAEDTRGVLVCGHIHEGVGFEQVGECLCYNAGSLAEPYGRRQVGLVHFVEDGARVDLQHHDFTPDEQWSTSIAFSPPLLAVTGAA
jgi:Icc-related predicted phosphoesterase